MYDLFKWDWEDYAEMITPTIDLVGDKITDENGNTYTITSVEEDNKTCELTRFSSAVTNLEKLVIPEAVAGFAVTSINAKVQSSRNEKTNTLTLPKTIRSICANAFREMKKLTTVYCYSESMEKYGTEVFWSNNDLKIYVPAISVETYKAAWPEFADCIFPLDELLNLERINNSTMLTSPAHNLHGQLVGANYKGIVVQNGKKIVWK